MGIQPDPGTFNNHCPRCWDVDKTPELLKAFISGITYNKDNFPGLPAAPNGYVDLTQTHIGCEWTGANDFIWRAIFQLTAVDSRLTIETEQDVFAFTAAPGDVCKFFFTNSKQDPNIFAYTGGWAYVSTPAEMQAIIELATPITGPDPRFELFPKANGHVVLRFCDIKSASNIEIDVDTALL